MTPVFSGAGHQPSQGIVARLFGKVTLPEQFLQGAARLAARRAQRFPQGRHEGPAPHRAVNQPFGFEFRVSVAHRGPMHSQLVGELAAGFQAVAGLEAAIHNALAKLIANLHVKRLA